MSLMKVTWRDAEYDAKEVPDYLSSMDCLVETIGFLVAEDKVYLTLARDCFHHSYYDLKKDKQTTDEFSCFLRIPKAVIIKRATLKDGN